MIARDLQPVLNTRDDSPFRFLGLPTAMRATGETTDGAFGLVEQWMIPPGFASPYHVHRLEDEAFYVLEGEMAFVCGGKWLTASPGTYVFEPRNIPRGFKVAGMVHDNDCVMFGQPSCRVDVDVHVCGDDPFAPWDGTVSSVSEGETLTTDVIWAFVPGVATSPVSQPYGYSQTWIDGRHQLEPPFQTIFTTSGSGGRQGPYTLPLEEDKTCPDNTPSGAG